MEEVKIVKQKMDEKEILNNLVKKAGKGNYIAVLLKDEKEYKKLVKILKNYMSFKRGIFVKNKGLIVLFLYEIFFKDIYLYKNNFDIIYELESDNE